MFEKKAKERLQSMRINPDSYYSYLSKKFDAEVIVFNEVLKYFDSIQKVGDHLEFNQFWEEKYPNKDTETELHSFSYELYNNLKRFYEDGVYNLFKFKQAEWGAPEIVILEADVPPDSNNKSSLNYIQTIYRGLDPQEHFSKDYYQSWTTCKEKAVEFSNSTYSYKPNGIVVKTDINKEDIIYYNENDPEKEVIVRKGAIKCAVKI